MRIIFLFSIILCFSACNNPGERSDTDNRDTTENPSAEITSPELSPEENNPGNTPEKDNEKPQPEKVYENKAFRNVRVIKAGKNSYTITGEARVFEATINYVVEDGHNELNEGFITASLGAPEWGEFKFSITPENVQSGTQPHLILFEASARDGSRTHELIIPLK